MPAAACCRVSLPSCVEFALAKRVCNCWAICAMRCGLPPMGCLVVCAKAPVQARDSARIVNIFFISFSEEFAIVRRQRCAAIRSMTGRILVDSGGEGNLEIMSPYVAVRCRTQGCCESGICGSRDME